MLPRLPRRFFGSGVSFYLGAMPYQPREYAMFSETETQSTDDQQPDERDAPDATVTTSEPDDAETLGEAGKTALKREREARKAAEQRLRDLEAAETKRQQDAEDAKRKQAEEQGEWEQLAKDREGEITSLKQQLAERDARDLRATVTKRHNLPDDLATRLTGETEDELDEDAKALAKLIGPQSAPDNDAGARTPKSERTQPDKKRETYADPAYWGLGPPR